MASQCPREEGSLTRVARQILERENGEEPSLNSSEIDFAMRAAGSPHVWPRAWTLRGSPIGEADSVARFKRWLHSDPGPGEIRCGVAVHREQGQPTSIAVLVVNALADLRPVPTQIPPGRWIDLRATSLVELSNAKLVVLGPQGAPRSLPTTLRGQEIFARVRIDRPGAWQLQLLTNVESGPRPVLEARVYAGQQPPARLEDAPAPGEQSVGASSDPIAQLTSMVAALRTAERLTSLHRDSRLDRIAQQHAEAMRATAQLGHDVGDGNPADRLVDAGIVARFNGENVARARSVKGAHRALWASPSHRANLLHEAFTAIGVGVAADQRGGVWVCETFADFGLAGTPHRSSP